MKKIIILFVLTIILVSNSHATGSSDGVLKLSVANVTGATNDFVFKMSPKVAAVALTDARSFVLLVGHDKTKIVYGSDSASFPVYYQQEFSNSNEADTNVAETNMIALDDLLDDDSNLPDATTAFDAWETAGFRSSDKKFVGGPAE